MEKIRNGVFETNSSSTHAIVVDINTNAEQEIFKKNEDVEIYGGEYGWEWETYNDFHSKLDYMITMTHDYDDFFERIKKLLKEKSGIEIQKMFDKDTFMYVDHEEPGIFTNMSDEEILQYLYNINSYVVTCNDNDESSSEYNDAEALVGNPNYKVYFKGN